MDVLTTLRRLLVDEAPVPLLVGRGVVVGDQADQIPRVAVLPRGQARQLLNCKVEPEGDRKSRLF